MKMYLTDLQTLFSQFSGLIGSDVMSPYFHTCTLVLNSTLRFLPKICQLHDAINVRLDTSGRKVAIGLNAVYVWRKGYEFNAEFPSFIYRR